MQLIRLVSEDPAKLLSGETLGQLEAAVLPEFFQQKRWYAAKDQGLPTVKLASSLSLGSANLSWAAIWQAGPKGEDGQNYFVPLALREDVADVPESEIIASVNCGGTISFLVDALADDDFVRRLIKCIEAGTSVRSDGSHLSCRHTKALGAIAQSINAAPSIERSNAEQSNTSARLGGSMLKAFRKLEAGIHPELEMSSFLTEQTEFSNVPALLGSVDFLDPAGSAITICVLQAVVPNHGDGWRYTVRIMTGILQNNADGADLLTFAGRLGRRTAEMHQALAKPTRDPAFAPEAARRDHFLAWSLDTKEQALSALEGLERAKAHLEPVTGVLASSLLAQKEKLLSLAVELPEHRQISLTRVHGDYHLGQVLVSANDVFIIDFEGEPLRPIAERRAKHSPLRDVAGMLRSFAYAASAAQREAGVGASSSLDEVSRKMSEAFLASYYWAVQGCPGFPVDLVQADELLDAFVLNKALYEVNYEIANRPDWISIPLSSVATMLNERKLPSFASVATATISVLPE